MSKTITAALKRRIFPVTMPDGDVLYVRALTHRESLETAKLEEPQSQIFFGIGCGLVESDGSSCFTREGRSASEFAKHVAEILNEIPLDSARIISESIGKATMPPSVESVAKN